MSNDNTVLKKKVNSINLTRFIEAITCEKESSHSPKRRRLDNSPCKDETSPEITEYNSPELLTYTPICDEWQKLHSSDLKLDIVRSTKVKHGVGIRDILVNEPLKTRRIKADGNCLFRSFSQILTCS